MSSTEPIYHYVSEASFYSAKSRAYLRQKRLDFIERMPSHPHYIENVIPQVGFMRMPTIEMPDGAIVQDTSDIIDFLEARYPDRPVYPDGVRQRLSALIIEAYADEGLLPAGLHYRWSYREDNDPFVLSQIASGIVADTPEQAWKQAEEFANYILGLVAVMGITDDTKPAINESTEELFVLLNEHFSTHPCLFGGRASIADFALMAPMYGHFERDPYPAYLMRRIAPRLMRWTERMNVREFPWPEFPDAEDGFYPDDEIPETTMAVLKLIAQDFFPEMSSLLDVYNGWCAEQPDTSHGAQIPSIPNGMAFCGKNQFALRGVTVDRVARIDTVWKWQRPLDYYSSLEGKDKAAADQLIDALGARDLFNKRPAPPVTRNANNLFVFGAAKA